MSVDGVINLNNNQSRKFAKTQMQQMAGSSTSYIMNNQMHTR